MKFLLLTLSSLVPATLWADFPKAWQFGFQDPATDLMGKVISLHNGISIVMAGVTLFVLILLFYVAYRFSAKRNPNPSTTTHNTVLEFFGLLYL